MTSAPDAEGRASEQCVAVELERTFREERGRALSALLRRYRDIELADDALQDACHAALVHWPERGIPQNACGWLVTTASRRILDRLRHLKVRNAKEPELIELYETQASWEESMAEEVPDERLRLIFTCCHPSLSRDTQIALTLRTLGGLTTEEIARAFLVPESTLAQRLVRAKRKIKNAKIPYRVPPVPLIADRRASACAVLYLIFNEGYAATSGEPIRTDLCREAIRLTRALVDLMPDDAEVLGLLALMLLTEARRPARLSGAGELVVLDDQDRSKWSQPLGEEGLGWLESASALRCTGPYQLQAAIAAVHFRAPSAHTTDWPAIVVLYNALARLSPSPVVLLNRAVAIGMAERPEHGLALLEDDTLAAALETYQPYYAALADLCRRAGRVEAATNAYVQAMSLTRVPAEKQYFERRLSELEHT